MCCNCTSHYKFDRYHHHTLCVCACSSIDFTRIFSATIAPAPSRPRREKSRSGLQHRAEQSFARTQTPTNLAGWQKFPARAIFICTGDTHTDMMRTLTFGQATVRSVTIRNIASKSRAFCFQLRPPPNGYNFNHPFELHTVYSRGAHQCCRLSSNQRCQQIGYKQAIVVNFMIMVSFELLRWVHYAIS